MHIAMSTFKVGNGLETSRLNDMVYVYYNLRLWVRKLQKTPDVDAISLDGIDTTAAWRVESEAPVMEQDLNWIHEDLEGGWAKWQGRR